MGDGWITVPAVSSAVAQQHDEASPFKKIVGINFLIFIVYFIFNLALLKFDEDLALSFIYLYPVQTVINFILAGVYAFIDKDKAIAYAFAGLLILVVGFGSCYLAMMRAF